MYLTAHLICCRSCKIHIQVFQTTVSHFEQQNLFVLYPNTLLQTVFFVHELIYVFQINGTLINAGEAVNFKIRKINAYATPKKCQEFVENRNKFIFNTVNLENTNKDRPLVPKRMVQENSNTPVGQKGRVWLRQECLECVPDLGEK